MFHDWDEYYLLIGSAAAALIGLLFVVATLNTNKDRAVAESGASIYMTPLIFHFAVVLVLSGLALAPGVTPPLAAAGVGLAALLGLAYAAVITIRVARREVQANPHWSDLWCYGIAPAVIYLAQGAVAVVLSHGDKAGELELGVVLMALLLTGIRNAWDLVTFLAPRQDQMKGKDFD